jgi:hypothetical protein
MSTKRRGGLTMRLFAGFGPIRAVTGDDHANFAAGQLRWRNEQGDLLCQRGNDASWIRVVAHPRDTKQIPALVSGGLAVCDKAATWNAQRFEIARDAGESSNPRARYHLPTD